MVAPLVAAAGISALGSLAGGVAGMFGAKSAQKRAEKLAGRAIQMRVADAQKAGIHPLFALGANVSTPGAINVGEPLGAALSEMGQNISRAVDVGGTKPDRAMNALALERAGLENQLLKVQIRNASAPAVGPPSPIGARSVIVGQGDAQQDVMLPGGILVPGTPGAHKADFATSNIGEFADVPYGIDAISKMAVSPDFWAMIRRKIGMPMSPSAAVNKLQRDLAARYGGNRYKERR